MTNLPYKHLTEACFRDAIGGGGLKTGDYEDVLAETTASIRKLRRAASSGSMPFLTLPGRDDDLGDLDDLFQDWRHGSYEDVVIIGTGGASLGGQTFCRLSTGDGPFRVRFLEDYAPGALDHLFRDINPAQTGFLVISKSGETPEIVAQFLAVLQRIVELRGEFGPATHFAVITGPKDSSIRRIAEKLRIRILEHDEKLGGRYSALSPVGLVPAKLAGLDPMAARAGAVKVFATLTARKPADCPPAVGAAIAVALMRKQKSTQSVLMTYGERLRLFGAWYCQLWAESLGKDGMGTTPIAARGPNDQHSVMQMFLDGPADKFFTFITTDRTGSGERIRDDFQTEMFDGILPPYLADRTLGDMMQVQQRATADTLAENGRPVRVFELERIDEHAIGAMMMHFMIETVIAAHLLGVDPFNQPAVDAGKALSRTYLEAMGASDAASGAAADSEPEPETAA